VTASYLLVEEVARLLRCSTRSVHELTRAREIPHRRLPGTRRCLFTAADLAAWMDGAQLEVVELPKDGRVVRPRRREDQDSPV
jgi:excisionase family DNA binding protein